MNPILKAINDKIKTAQELTQLAQAENTKQMAQLAQTSQMAQIAPVATQQPVPQTIAPVYQPAPMQKQTTGQSAGIPWVFIGVALGAIVLASRMRK
ncbi:MAG TPA: hypothetical protein PLA69_04285 [Flavobacterium sp.]|nr:hypothetical protein [Flavobacterium sp.]